MLGKTSSAPGRADGRGFRLHPLGVTDARPFHCFRDRAHAWKLVKRMFVVVLNGILIDNGRWLEERCRRCGAVRPFQGGFPK